MEDTVLLRIHSDSTGRPALAEPEGSCATAVQAPADSAFIGGSLHLHPPGISISETSSPDSQNAIRISDTPAISCLIILLTIIGIANLRKLIRIFPSLAGCLLRWKENVNLEDSVRLSTARNTVYAVIAIPFCLLAAGYRLYSPDFLEPMHPTGYTLAVTGVFIAYIILRVLLSYLLQNKRISSKTYKTAFLSFRTYFITMTLAMLSTAGITSIAGAGQETVKAILLHEAAAVYLVFLIRKAQIFKSSCSLFSAILYLCGLEIFPTGILIASAIVL